MKKIKQLFTNIKNYIHCWKLFLKWDPTVD